MREEGFLRLLLLTILASYAAQTNIVVNPKYYPPSAYDRIWRFDDRVFDLPETRTEPTRRDKGEDIDYNSAQRELWIRRCAKWKASDWERFRECFVEERRKNAEEIQRQYDEVQARHRPLRNR